MCYFADVMGETALEVPLGSEAKEAKKGQQEVIAVIATPAIWEVGVNSDDSTCFLYG